MQSLTFELISLAGLLVEKPMVIALPGPAVIALPGPAIAKITPTKYTAAVHEPIFRPILLRFCASGDRQ